LSRRPVAEKRHKAIQSWIVVSELQTGRLIGGDAQAKLRDEILLPAVLKIGSRESDEHLRVDFEAISTGRPAVDRADKETPVCSVGHLILLVVEPSLKA
jgi:hypothetical protein